MLYPHPYSSACTVGIENPRRLIGPSDEKPIVASDPTWGLRARPHQRTASDNSPPDGTFGNRELIKLCAPHLRFLGERPSDNNVSTYGHAVGLAV